VNNYAAPVAAFTGQWAYFDPAISRAVLSERGGRAHIAGDRKYLWFADRSTNTEYRRPEYFLCMIPQSPVSLRDRILRVRGQGVRLQGCRDLPLVRLATESGKSLRGMTLVDYDRTGLEEVGFESWAIVKLEWDQASLVLDWTLGHNVGVRPEGN
jgi:hypothetical protein